MCVYTDHPPNVLRFPMKSTTWWFYITYRQCNLSIPSKEVSYKQAAFISILFSRNVVSNPSLYRTIKQTSGRLFPMMDVACLVAYSAQRCSHCVSARCYRRWSITLQMSGSERDISCLSYGRGFTDAARYLMCGSVFLRVVSDIPTGTCTRVRFPQVPATSAYTSTVRLWYL